MALKERKVAFIGAGHITTIILDNLIETETVSPHNLIASDPDKGRLQRLSERCQIATAQDNCDAVKRADFVFINVPPQSVRDVIDGLKREPFPENKLVISLAAGITMDAYSCLGDKISVVRALPNPPSQIGMGIAALAFNPYVSDEQRSEVFELFASLGEYVVLAEERINAVTALSSPAATYLFFQSLIDAGIGAGIDRETSTKIVYQTIVGAMEVWKKRQVSLDELLSEASTPGGISEESILTLEKHAFRAAVNEAIGNATLKAKRLGDSIQGE
jgi:pyrroline-5-carboxylate reductase